MCVRGARARAGSRLPRPGRGVQVQVGAPLSLSLSLWKLNPQNVTKHYSSTRVGPILQSQHSLAELGQTTRRHGRWRAPRTLGAALAICWLSRSAWRRAEDALFKTRSREMSALPQKSYPHSRRIRLSHCEAQLMAHAPMLPCSHAPMLPCSPLECPLGRRLRRGPTRLRCPGGSVNNLSLSHRRGRHTSA